MSSVQGHESRRQLPGSHCPHGAHTNPSQHSPVVHESHSPSCSPQYPGHPGNMMGSGQAQKNPPANPTQAMPSGQIRPSPPGSEQLPSSSGPPHCGLVVPDSTAGQSSAVEHGNEQEMNCVQHEPNAQAAASPQARHRARVVDRDRQRRQPSPKQAPRHKTIAAQVGLACMESSHSGWSSSHPLN